MYFPVVLALCLGFVFSCGGLEAIPAGRLPELRFEIVAVYDNESSIYLLGGKTGEDARVAEILKFDIFTESLEVVGHFPEGISEGSAHLDNEGAILYFGGEFGNPSVKSSTVWKIETNSAQVEPIPTGVLPHPIASHVSAYDGLNTFLIQGGYTTEFQSQVYSYDKIRTTGHAFTLANPTPRTSSASALIGSAFLLFGGFEDGLEDGFQNTIVEYDLGTGTKRVVEETTFEFGVTGAVAVTTGELVYVVGGGNRVPVEQKHQLSTYDLGTNLLQAHLVDGMRTNLYRPGVVHVPILNRIYVFGGREYGTPSGTETVDEIFYIPLDDN